MLSHICFLFTVIVVSLDVIYHFVVSYFGGIHPICITFSWLLCENMHKTRSICNIVHCIIARVGLGYGHVQLASRIC